MKLFLLLLFLVAITAGRDFYKILGVDKRASKNSIKRAYRDLAKKLHPDKNKDDKDAESKFQDINLAYEVLSNDQKRKKYDKYGEEGLKEGGDGFGSSNMDPFSSFFGDFFDFEGGGSHRREPSEIKGSDISIELFVTLEEIYSSNFIEIVRNRPVKKSESGTRKCNCHYEMRTKQISPGRFTMNQVEVCDECSNYRFVLEERLLEVEVEHGCADGETFKFTGEGEPHPDGDPGDLIFTFRQVPHKIFHRKNNDLYVNVTINLVDALIGFSYNLKHLDDHIVKLERKSITWSGAIMRIKNEGMPLRDNPNKFGNLYVTFNVAFPRETSSFSQEDKETIAKLFKKQKDYEEIVEGSNKENAQLIKTGNGPPLSYNGIFKQGPSDYLPKYI